MYELPIPELRFRDPWKVSLAERVRQLKLATTRIAYFYEMPDGSTFRYRCHTMTQTLNDLSQKVGAAWFSFAELPRLLDLVREVDVLVICRAKYTAELAHLVATARGFGARVLYDCDDLVFDVGLVPLMVATLDQHDPVSQEAVEATWNHWFSYVSRIRSAMQLADGVIVTNEFLGAKVEQSVGLPTAVIPNFMSSEQVQYSRALTLMRDSAGGRRGPLMHIGYFSGTPTHNRDFAILAPGLAEVLRARPEVHLRIVGYLHIPEWFSREFYTRIDQLELTHYMNLQRLIAETEVNVVPLQVNAFTNAKSELKFFDAAAVAIPTIASPTITMESAIQHGATGLLAEPSEWAESLEHLISHYDDVGKSMGRAANAVALEKYTAAGQWKAICSELGRLGEVSV